MVVGGIPKLKGKTVADKKTDMKMRMDYLRTALIHEPRGHDNMFGAVLVEPAAETADFGIIFMDGEGYLNMCGHNTIAAVTIAIETGMVDIDLTKDSQQTIKLETPAGLVSARANIVDHRVESVAFQNVASFLYKKNLVINIENLGEIKYDIAFGGSFFIMVNVKQLPFSIIAENSALFSKWGKEIRIKVNQHIEVQHPDMPYINQADLVEFYEELSLSDEVVKVKNVVVFGNGQIDRSPCGTGTSAKLATLYAKNEIQIGQTLENESILGTVFKGKIIEEASEDIGFKAVIPEISGSAYITGMNHFFIDPNDPLKYGFELK